LLPICSSDKEMIRWFLNHGADPNSYCDRDSTPAALLAMYTALINIINYLF
ncbi:hypothetical protein BDU57DRAFT_455740, partial [Ampelomyces quisqualis]